MKIRSKIILIFIPLIMTPLIAILIVAIFSARNGITRISTEFLSFKMEMLNNYMSRQWNILEDSGLSSEEPYVNVTKEAIEVFSGSLVGNYSEIILALDKEGEIVFSTEDLILEQEEKETLLQLMNSGDTGWKDLRIKGISCIAETAHFPPFDWFVLIVVERLAFYGEIRTFIFRTILLSALGILSAVVLLLYFSSYLTKPLEHIVDTIKTIILTNDLSAKVSLQYQDETGKLGHYFNIMTEELDNANKEIKHFALQSVIAKRKEMKIRNIFQKYVPKSVIDRYSTDPESMLVGENRILGILFSDIRSFTSISEGLPPDKLVESLNRYFELMVESITKHNGIVDKYIGDAIMAFFGAPVHSSNDALHAVSAGLDMLDSLQIFNQWQKDNNRSEFRIGIGINYGLVTIGNIGSEKKMDYTVIGDMVNLASRLEGLTKLYREPLLISDSLYGKIKDSISCRWIDKVIVKGKHISTNIFAPGRNMTDEKTECWKIHNEAMSCYFKRDFKQSLSLFREVQKHLPNDYSTAYFMEKCKDYLKSPPPDDWTGARILESK